MIWNGSRLDFNALQRRLAGGAARIARQARTHPASYMVFDVRAVGGRDLRDEPWRVRRAALEELADGWVPPLQLSPVTDDLEVARAWMADFAAAGIEGLVVKGAASRSAAGKRGWVKVRSRQTAEVIVGAVIGPLAAPEALVAGAFRDGVLRMVGRSSALTAAQSRSLAGVVRAAGDGHPWPDTMAANRFGGADRRVALTRVEPTVVVEVDADTALQDGVWWHALRYRRQRLDLTVRDLT